MQRKSKRSPPADTVSAEGFVYSNFLYVYHEGISPCTALGDRGLIPSGGTDLSLLHSLQAGSQAHLVSHPIGTEAWHGA
jgi:hypothetical protein